MVELTKSKSLSDLTDIINELQNSQQYEPVFHLIIEKIKRLYYTQTCAVILIDPFISIGLSVCPVNGITIEELMLTGKHALFEAQREIYRGCYPLLIYIYPLRGCR